MAIIIFKDLLLLLLLLY